MFTANLWMFPSSTPCVRTSQRKSSETLVIAGVCQPWDRDMDMHQDSQKTKKSKKRDLRFSNTAKHIKAEVLCCYLFIGWMLPVALIHSFLFTIHPLHPLKCILLQLCPFGSLYNSGFSSRLNTVWGCRLAALSSWPFTASHSPTGLIWLRNCKGTGICETILFKSTFKSAVVFFFFCPTDLLCSSYTNNCISPCKDVLSCGTKICRHEATALTVSFLTCISARGNFHSVTWQKKFRSCQKVKQGNAPPKISQTTVLKALPISVIHANCVY